MQVFADERNISTGVCPFCGSTEYKEVEKHFGCVSACVVRSCTSCHKERTYNYVLDSMEYDGDTEPVSSAVKHIESGARFHVHINTKELAPVVVNAKIGNHNTMSLIMPMMVNN